MTERRWVVNASPLIFLAQIDALSLLKALASEILVPFSVRHEVLVPKGHKPLIELPDWLSLREDLSLPPEIAGWDLGAGESQVLAHALLPAAKPSWTILRAGSVPAPWVYLSQALSE